MKTRRYKTSSEVFAWSNDWRLIGFRQGFEGVRKNVRGVKAKERENWEGVFSRKYGNNFVVSFLLKTISFCSFYG